MLEQEPELHLDAMPGRHDHVLVFMERGANTEGVGAVSLADLGRAIKRFTPRRIVVGEVRGPEVIDMLEAMTQGIAGSMCTIHADSSWSVFPRLPVYARAGGRDWATGDVLQLAALALDVIVFLARDRTGRRVVSEVRHVQRFDRRLRTGGDRRVVPPRRRRSCRCATTPRRSRSGCSTSWSSTATTRPCTKRCCCDRAGRARRALRRRRAVARGVVVAPGSADGARTSLRSSVDESSSRA